MLVHRSLSPHFIILQGCPKNGPLSINTAGLKGELWWKSVILGEEHNDGPVGQHSKPWRSIRSPVRKKSIKLSYLPYSCVYPSEEQILLDRNICNCRQCWHIYSRTHHCCSGIHPDLHLLKEKEVIRELASRYLMNCNDIWVTSWQIKVHKGWNRI